MSSVARFDTWQAADGTNVARKVDNELQVWNGSAWVGAGYGPATISGTTGSPTITSGTAIGGVTYDLYEFTGSGSINVTRAGEVDVMILAGGGSGGVRNATDFEPGGGGGGGVLEKTITLPVGTATITVGGGAAGVSPDANGTRGSQSSVGTAAFSYGGGGGIFSNGREPSGGTGAGASNVLGSNYDQFLQYDGTVMGYAGGAGQGNSGGTNGGGGGGGAGAVGQDGTTAVGGDGGAGRNVTITGSATTYGGGGGGRRSSGSSGAGGTGGGTSASGAGTSTSAAANTGGGSGAGRTGSGNGGSGIVIVRVAV